MATRTRVQRGGDGKEFEGRVRKWTLQWQSADSRDVKLQKLRFYKWTQTSMFYYLMVGLRGDGDDRSSFFLLFACACSFYILAC